MNTSIACHVRRYQERGDIEQRAPGTDVELLDTILPGIPD
jgi:hypothetical protein